MYRLLLLASLWLVASASQAAPWAAQCIQPIAVGQTVTGQLSSSDCMITFEDSFDVSYVDVYAFQGVRGQQIAIQMTADTANLDSYLELHGDIDRNSDPLELDDDGGGDFNARIPSDIGFFTLPETGTYYIWASSLFGDTGAYKLTLFEPGANPFASQCISPIVPGQTVTGMIDRNDCFVTYDDPARRYYTDVYTFEGTEGQQIAIAMNSTDVDAWIELHVVNDVQAEPIFTGDDEVGTNARIPDFAGFFTLPKTGRYYIWANTGRPNQVGAYSLTLYEGKRLTVTEFYHPAFNHYFITAYPDEAASLAAGNLPPWVPTGQTFDVWSGTGTFVDQVWRFFSASFAPLSSHFYTNNPGEAASLTQGNVWQLEADNAFFMAASPDGTCPDESRPLYRLYNDGQGGAPNHRYTVDSTIRSQMIGAGWIPEGNGPDGVFACVPTP